MSNLMRLILGISLLFSSFASTISPTVQAANPPSTSQHGENPQAARWSSLS